LSPLLLGINKTVCLILYSHFFLIKSKELNWKNTNYQLKQVLSHCQHSTTLKQRKHLLDSILCIIPLVFKKDNPFVLKHSKQGLILFLGEVAVFIIHIILGYWILRLGMFIFGVFSFIGLVASLQGRDAQLPIVSKLAEAITL